MSAPSLTSLAAASLQVPSPERALVTGCGNGDAVLFLAREFPSARIRGVDRSAEKVREATARTGLDPEGRVAFKHGGGSRLPFPDGFFDLVVLFDLGTSPAEIARVLQPGGHLVGVGGGERAGAVAGIKEKLLRRRLSRRRIEQIATTDAGDGNFFVARLRDGD